MVKKTRPSWAQAETPPTDTAECGAANCLIVGLDCRSMNPYRFLRVRFPWIDRGTLQQWLQDGKVAVNGAPIHDSSPLRAGDIVEIDANVSARQRRERRAVTVLSIDAEAAVVDKDSGLACSPDGRGSKRNLCDLLHEQLGDEGSAFRAVHHIDKSASGVVVLARTRSAKQTLTQDFVEGRVEWDFLALVSGEMMTTDVLVDRPIEAHVGRKTRWALTESGGRPARTRVRLLHSFSGYSLVQARVLEGRSHQVRLHLQHLGHTIVGDDWYGGERELRLSDLKAGYRKRRGESERPLLNRLAFHSMQIQLPWPGTGQARDFRAPIPRDLRGTLKQLQKHAGRDSQAALQEILEGRIPPWPDDPSGCHEPAY